MLRVSAIDSWYGHVQCLHGVSLEVLPGQLVALVGSNGAGKTTLLKTVSGLQPARHGSVAFDGRALGDLPAHRRVGLGIAHCPEGRCVFSNLSVDENLRLGGQTRTPAEVERGLQRMYAMFPVLADKRAQMSGLLSGGQQQMLAIGRALMSRPRLLLLDEPSMGLAPLIVAEVFAIIDGLRREGMTILLVEQNAHEALPLADHAYVLESGRVVHSGAGADLLNDPMVREAYLGLGVEPTETRS
ncbi:ABC transporter ATP-binding protein [Caenimonas sedimenti]|uniref:ABC transporter ATP-binding protein n=1 Tax=Caenimonas sedimenti TaxID=2596921 RepID=A0A562ZT57_9BURK|nr:ABC transporter ATP-binding protein [Caenimonas sedimenti]TWO71546.1 ABC transporter ATP-binding protein [Caenimonas sedimenti]